MIISLAEEVVVVTGGAIRLGRAIALQCARSGASVAITYNSSKDEAEETLRDLQAESTRSDQKFAALPCDVTQAADVARLSEGVFAAVGKPTALVNNAAIFRRTPFAETAYSQWELEFDLHVSANLKGPYLLCKRFGDLFLEQKRGSIINLADIYGKHPLKNYVPYCISKAGVIMMTEALAKALAPHVRVNCICPGTILPPSPVQGTENADGETMPAGRVPMGRLGTPEEIGAAVAFLIGGPSFITGAILPVDGGERLR